MACVGGEYNEAEEDLDMDDAEFQVLDCWEDGDEGEGETYSSQNSMVYEETSKVPNRSPDDKSRTPSNKNKKAQEEGLKANRRNSATTASKKKGGDSQDNKKSSHRSSIDSHLVADRGLQAENAMTSCNASTNMKDKICTELRENHNTSRTKTNVKANSSNSGCTPKNHLKSGFADSTETKVDNFLKEMALQHPQVNHLKGTSCTLHECPDTNNESLKKISNINPAGKASIDLSILPPGVDLDQVADDTSTLNIIASAKSKIDSSQAPEPSSRHVPLECANLSTSLNLTPRYTEPLEGANVKSCRIAGRLYADYSDIIPKNKIKWSRSSHKLSQPRSSVRCNSPQQKPWSPGGHCSSSPLKGKRDSHSPSLSLSPSPPRFHPRYLSNPVVRESHLAVENRVHKFQPSLRPLTYRSPSIDRDYYRRSRDSSVLRALSRSLSRDRSYRHSRTKSRSRSKSLDRRQSRSGRRESHSTEDTRRKYVSSSRSKSPGSRIRSRNSLKSVSSSPDRQRYRRARSRSPSFDENRPKKPRLSVRTSRSRTRSRSRSPWRPRTDLQSTEWFGSVSRQNGSNSTIDDVRLEHDMERFIATNMAATGQLRQPVLDWLDVPNGKDFNFSSDPSYDLDQSMPIPPPPPDISELMTSDDRQEEVQIIPNQNVSLSSLLESAVSGVPSQAVIDRCQDAVMKLHDNGIKQGRFNVLSLNIEPQQSLPALVPWQSILHRSTLQKVHFSFTKQPENLVFWKPDESSKTFPVASSHLKGGHELLNQSTGKLPSVETLVGSESYEQERSALLEKIAFLTKELHEVKQELDSMQVLKISVAMQTEPYTPTCAECGKLKDLRKDTKQMPHSRTVMKPPTLSSTSSLHAFPHSSSAKPSTSSSYLFCQSSSSTSPTSPLCQFPYFSSPVAPSSLPNPQKSPGLPTSSFSFSSSVSKQANSLSSNLPSLFSTSAPQPVPPPCSPVQGSSQHPHIISEPTISATPNSATFYDSACNSKQSWSPMQTSKGLSEGQITSGLSSIHSPLDQKTSKSIGQQNTGNTSAKYVDSAQKIATMLSEETLDYKVNSHQMVGDEHMFDLVAYLSTTGPAISVDPKYCSPGQTVDKLLNLFSSKSGIIESQIIIMVSIYNVFNNSWDAYLKKYAHLIGFLRKRCSHLVLIEPPPVPRLVSSLPYWNSVNALVKLLKSWKDKSDNLSIVLTHELLMHGSQAPNPAFYVNDKRLSEAGLKIVADELCRVLSQAKTAHSGMSS